MNKVASIIFAITTCTTLGFSHGDVTPQAMDTKGLKKVDPEAVVNPYRGNEKAIGIGKSGYNTNCARCHGLGAISGGIAPDLRYLDPKDDDTDEYFIGKVQEGAVRNGNVYMPPFKDILSPEAIWSIRSWLETVPVKD
ncbi:MAG: cytochrome c-550 PedF [Arcobacter sp.]|nr:cytochrome c-550 PedF [Arcobacter sp.]